MNVKHSNCTYRVVDPKTNISARCEYVFTCTHPDKKTCKAVQAEINYMSEQLQAFVEATKKKLNQLKVSIK